MQRCTDQRGDSLSQKRIPPLEPQEKGLGLAVSGLNTSDVSEVKVPRARRSRVSIARRFASAPTIRCCAAVGGSAALWMRRTPCGCRSAHLVGVRSNFRLPPVPSMRRAQQCRYFARSLPPRKRHSRLTTVRRGCCQITTRRDSWRSHVHRTHTAQRVQFFKLQTANVRGQGAGPLAFSWGSKGDILSRERISPLSAAPHGVGKSRSLFGMLPLRAMRGKREDFSFEKPSLFTYFLLCRSNYSASCIAFAAATAFACASAEHCS